MLPYISFLGRSFSSYGILMTVGIILACVLSIRRFSKLGGHWEDVMIVGACSIGLGLFCGSVLYAFVTYPIAEIISLIRAGKFFAFGGLVFYGGLLGGLAGALIGIRVAGCQLQAMEWAVVPTIPLGHAFGRIGCVMAGCCHGIPYSGPFALYYPASVSGLSPEQGYFPMPLLEATLNLLLYFWLLGMARKSRPAGWLLSAYLMAYSVIRFTLEFFRGDAVRGHFLSLSVSQWVSILILSGCLIWKLYSIVSVKKTVHIS